MSDFLASLNPAPTRLPRPEPLAATITRRASHQAYYTIRWLVDRDRVANAYRAYGYFRWVDDRLDLACLPPAERLLFIEHQRSLTDLCYQGQWPRPRSAEEELLVDLIRSDTELESGLQSYIRNMLAVMAFDVERRGRLVTRAELTRYTHWLAMAVTDALHYFIGHSCQHPIGQAQYLAASGAHIVHMLRDTVEDIRLGYFNIPREYIEAYPVDPTAIPTDP